MGLTREFILTVQDRKPVAVSVPEWGGEVMVRKISKRERDELLAGFKSDAGSAISNMQTVSDKLLVSCLVDDEGRPMFVESDLAALKEKSPSAVDGLVGELLRINGFTSAVKAEPAKNSEAAPTSSSPTA